MTDPVLEAARRVLDYWTKNGWNASRDFVAEAAAREALVPIRALHFVEPYAQGPDYCAECEHRWPCDTARLIYTTEELNGDS